MRKGRVLLCASLVSLGSTAFLFLWSISSAQLRFMRCPEGYALFADNAECRLPAALQLLWIDTLALTALFGLLGLRSIRPMRGPAVD